MSLLELHLRELLDRYGKDYLLRVTEHYAVEIPGKGVKESVIRSTPLAGLVEKGILSVSPVAAVLQPLNQSP